MAVFTTSTPPDNSSAAAFRIWTKSISDTIVAGGWLMTSDTGQINFTTVTAPGVVNTSAGYNIFKMNDSLQATAPCYLKLEYGCGASTTYPAIWVSVGTGTDGAGNLTGFLGVRAQVYYQGNSISYFTSRYSIDTNRLTVALWAQQAYGFFFCVERMHDSTGADTNLGILYATANTAGAGYSGAVYTTGPNTSYMSGWNVVLPTTVTSMAFGSTVYLTPVRTIGLGETSPFLGMSVYYNPDLTAFNPILTKIWDGNNRYVLPMWIPNGTATTSGASGAIAMRYD